ncbi:MAG TPA: acyl-CoA dehydrogenase family protein, partial [Chthonomonadaceae bacterium]|nr:acyl-CoA dehydrogenase family protein [Chthonomonadaceae bacterium]
RAKLAEMAIRTFALESMLYRTGGYLDAVFSADFLTQRRGDAKSEIQDLKSKTSDPGEDSDTRRREHSREHEDGQRGDGPDQEREAQAEQEGLRSAAEEYAIECAICKVFATETLDFVVDEALQIHGGYGFSEEFPVAQAYRDARVFRIFEGTNEINRLTIVDQLRRRVKAGRISMDLAPAAGVPGGHIVHDVHRTPAAAVAAALQCAHGRFGQNLMAEQEIVGNIADLAIGAYAIESAARRATQTDRPAARSAAEFLTANATVLAAARLAAVVRGCGDVGPASVALPTTETVALRRQVADAVLERDGYPW